MLPPEIQRHPLLTHLQEAVPAEIECLRGTRPDTLLAMARDAAPEIHERGDVIQYGGDGTATAALTCVLAVLALTAWGGVQQFAGLHWCATPACRDPRADHDMPIWPDTTHMDPPVRRRSVITVTTGGQL